MVKNLEHVASLMSKKMVDAPRCVHGWTFLQLSATPTSCIPSLSFCKHVFTACSCCSKLFFCPPCVHGSLCVSRRCAHHLGWCCCKGLNTFWMQKHYCDRCFTFLQHLPCILQLCNTWNHYGKRPSCLIPQGFAKWHGPKNTMCQLQ